MADIPQLREAVSLACKPTFIPRITKGREQVLAMPRDFVLANIEQVASECLDLSDYWEYRRLLELADSLDKSLVRRLAKLGLNSTDPDVQEAAEDFSDR